MKRVLFMAYNFPPVGGAGTQRSLQFVRHLPSFGFEPVVITGPGEARCEWMPADPTLAAQLAHGVTVDRVAGPVPAPTSENRARVDRMLGAPSPFIRWWQRGALTSGLRHESIDAVFASLSPYESAFAAAAIARRRGVPLVLDLRDPWALDEMLTWPTGAHHRIELRRMRRGLAAADAVVMNTPEAVRRVRAAFPALADKMVVAIPNGFDGDDFAARGSNQDRFRIVHTGALHTEFGQRLRTTSALRARLGGISPADPYTRSHVFLMEALARIVDRRPELRPHIELHLAGALSEADRAIDGLGLITEHGYLPQSESVALVRSADLLFLPMHDLPPGHRATIVPGKTYEYLGSGRPLLAAVPDGDARDMLSALPWAHVTRPADAEAMAETIVWLIERKLARGGPEPDGDVSLVQRYERRALTTELADVLDRVIAAHRTGRLPDAVTA